ncbi:polysaccharide pyruvyl transferase WcaK-like protein [Kribbella antiqua]|uniref:Polysaccharide pyruvyl transferase WcaK-like protein n=1 Tax=Kribbella antiqua TaxID=2512217 RepID=A0A4R2J2Y5_9ACTN|nr:polysaccharide pyruvyl transferase family protein [Kribbella antiqua]TCO52067.1 polysaccharide pyruvyl transferase WcaK-like protein [Kribbella antiqua]
MARFLSRPSGPVRTDDQVRVGLFGRFGSGNVGNDASLEAILQYLKAERPDAVLDGLFSEPERVAARFGLPATRLSWLRTSKRSRSRLLHAGLTMARIGLGALVDAGRTAAWVRRHDVVIVPGMGLLESDLPQRPWEFPYSLLLLSAAGKLFGTKVALVSVGATVVRQRLTGRMLATAARLAYYRSFRDEQSLDAARRMGMAHEGDQVYPDLVFALPTPPVGPGPTGVVGVGVMAYRGTPTDRHRADRILAEYTEKMTQFVRSLTGAGHKVRLLIGDANDEPVALEILADARSRRSGPGELPVVFEPFSTVDELMAQLGTVDSVVGTRFHTVLVALMLGKPTVAIGYGRKHVELMNQMGVGDWVQNIRDLDVELLERQVAALATERDRIIRTLTEREAANRAWLGEQFAELTAVLFEPSRVP